MIKTYFPDITNIGDKISFIYSLKKAPKLLLEVAKYYEWPNINTQNSQTNYDIS